MKRHLALLLVGIFSFFVFLAKVQASERKMILRQAQERGRSSVAVEAYLIDDILEATIYARMYATKPKIFGVVLVGPKLGRLGFLTKEVLYPKAEEEDEEMVFPTKDVEGGYIRFSKRTQDKRTKGALTREMVKFKIPVKKIMPKKRYELRIKIESMQTPGKIETFNFPLKDFAQAFEQ
ncbi:MAG: hypothetical protein AMJ95_10740 [Omnitrophica WOR_2 bacterium SM23_72]|nr:MAG: hypothetical protein AMJ95_10740 [Omnitrophica WOR_2 bacterium SM23_72]